MNTTDNTNTMKASEKKKLIIVNLAVWIVAILTHPIACLGR